MSYKRKVENLDEFRKWKTEKGYMVLTDPRQNSIHKSSCRYLNEINFERSKKKYTWIAKIENIEKEFDNLRPCAWCNPFNKNLIFDKY